MLPIGVLQVREGAAAAGVLLGGENALPCFVPGGVDEYALDRIVYNTKPWSPPLQVSQRPVLGCMSACLHMHTPFMHEKALLNACTCLLPSVLMGIAWVSSLVSMNPVATLTHIFFA